MKKLLFEFEIDNLQPEDEIEASDIYGLMYQRFPLSLVSVRAVEHGVQRTCAKSPDGNHHFEPGESLILCVYCGTSR